MYRIWCVLNRNISMYLAPLKSIFTYLFRLFENYVFYAAPLVLFILDIVSRFSSFLLICVIGRDFRKVINHTIKHTLLITYNIIRELFASCSLPHLIKQKIKGVTICYFLLNVGDRLGVAILPLINCHNP